MNKLTFSFAGSSIEMPFVTLEQFDEGDSHAAAMAFNVAPMESSGGKPPSKKKRMEEVASRVVKAVMMVHIADRQNGLNRIGPFDEASIPMLLTHEPNIITIPTASIIVSGSKKGVRKEIVSNIHKRFGLDVMEEGFRGKVLMRAKEDGRAGIEQVQHVLNWYSGNDSVSPNFLRVREHRRIDAVDEDAQGVVALAPTLPWNLQNLGTPGVAGADVKAVDGWGISKGTPSIRVAVLDEGVDIHHPALQAAIVLSKDFIGTNPDSSPSGNDAHGTACAGIIASRNANYPGLAPKVSLIGVRIAHSNPSNPTQWIFDDFKTADAIDWCWEEAAADVLSNSWGGGAPSDAIRLAFERARTQGRSGKGCVIAIAAGNTQSAIPFPATLPNMLVVGASNQWDQRKTKTSLDGETWWGSCFGSTMGLVAPGVKIKTTDITGTSGYSTGNFVDTFNGTSSATPHVAAAAALVLSVDSALTEKQVRKILTSTCDSIAGTPQEVGAGRLNVHAALLKAQTSTVSPQSSTKKQSKKTPKKTSKKTSKKTTNKKANPKKTSVQQSSKKTSKVAKGLAKSSKKSSTKKTKKASKKASPKTTAKKTHSKKAVKKKIVKKKLAKRR